MSIEHLIFLSKYVSRVLHLTPLFFNILHINTFHLQAVEFRIRKLEELSQQTLAHLGVIHRFMATYMPNEELAGLEAFDNIRQRRVSER